MVLGRKGARQILKRKIGMGVEIISGQMKCRNLILV
jgi:hypothetical protein